MKKLTVLIGPLLLVFVWFMVNKFSLVDQFLLPGPKQTFSALIKLFSQNQILTDIQATLSRTALAFVIATLLGIPLGLILGKTAKIYRSVELVIDFFRSTPATALFPLFLLFFGIGNISKIAVTGFAAFLIIIFNTAYGVLNIKKHRIITAQIMGAKKHQIFKWIIFWESLPQTFIGLRNAVSLSLVVIIVTEMFIGTQAGLGRKIIDFQLIYEIDAMYATIIIAGLLGYLLNLLILFLEKKLMPWSTNEK